ncbi:MAG: hypothetical protein JW910_13000, partial [Anaerolineae bacterium]|nr:hypothetical protein [Anaerolineae bacterium]
SLPGMSRPSTPQFTRLEHEPLEKVYPLVLDNADAIFEWTQGTGQVPYLERLPEPLRAPFQQEYRARLRHTWPQGPIFYPFTRILFAATR